MMERFWVKNPLYPVVSIAVMLTTFVGALLMARSVCGAVFLAAVYLLFAVFGYGKNCLRLLPFLAGYLLLFSAIFYVCSGGNLTFTGQMVIRLAGVVIAAIPGLSLPPVALVRNLTALHCPRLLTLGMLISMSFVPVLSAEIRQVRNAMKTRGVISVFNPTVFYRAFFIPLIVRLVNISDTLALSVETRGFVAEGDHYTVYHPVKFQTRDAVFILLYGILFVAAVLFAGMEVPAG